MQSFDRNVTGIGALADPVRRQLYRFVCSQPQPVTRDQAAAAVAVARHKAKFHLDRLEAEGLLETDYVRSSGRTGPGAGRPAKRYRRGGRSSPLLFQPETTSWLATSWPRPFRNRRAPAHQSLTRSIARQPLGAQPSPRRQLITPSGLDAAPDFAVRILTEQAYEPRRIDRTLVLANCPFHHLAVSHTDLVCRLNHSLLSGFVDAIAPDLLKARLEPGENRCCVTLVALPE